MKYLLGTGFVDGPGRREFAEIWRENIMEYCSPDPQRVVVLGVGIQSRPIELIGFAVDWISLPGNLGHIGDLIAGRKDRAFCGWSASVMALAMIAYNDESDFIYREQDCLCFGPWVEQLYADLGDGDMAFGKKMETPPFMECAQSLFIVRHRFIPKFVATYLAMGDERRKDRDGKEDNLPERKFVRIEEKFGTDRIKRLSFGVDRERPLPFDDPVWYCQQLNDGEILELKNRELI